MAPLFFSSSLLFLFSHFFCSYSLFIAFFYFFTCIFRGLVLPRCLSASAGAVGSAGCQLRSPALSHLSSPVTPLVLCPPFLPTPSPFCILVSPPGRASCSSPLTSASSGPSPSPSKGCSLVLPQGKVATSGPWLLRPSSLLAFTDSVALQSVISSFLLPQPPSGSVCLLSPVPWLWEVPPGWG